jgi:hypothetical protein
MKIVGIAAHPDLQCAVTYARYEACEKEMLENIKRERVLYARSTFRWGLLSIALTSTNHGWFCIGIGNKSGYHFAVSAFRNRKHQALIKVWEEIRNVCFFGAEGKQLKTYSTATRLIDDEWLNSPCILVKPSFRYLLSAPLVPLSVVEREAHYVAYCTEKSTHEKKVL